MLNDSRKFRANDGVTLVELMIAAGILATVFVFLLQGVIDIDTTNSIGANYVVANTQLSSVVEEIRSLTYDELLAYQPPALPGLGASASMQVACTDNNGAQIMLPTATGSFPNPIEVQVTILWQDKHGRLHTDRMSTLHRR